MKLSEDTINVLKNFVTINNGMVFRKGKYQRTMDSGLGIIAHAVIEEEIPQQFGIYDLNQFLCNVTTLDNPELTFEGEYVVMNDGELTFDYMACSPNLVITPPEKELVLKTVDIKFTIQSAMFQKLLKMATMNSLPNLSIEGKNGSLNIIIHEKANDTSNRGAIKIGEYADKDFIATFKTENLKLVADDYNVEVQTGAFAKFENKAGNLKYFIALETK